MMAVCVNYATYLLGLFIGVGGLACPIKMKYAANMAVELTTTTEVVDALGGISAVAALTGSKYTAVHNWRVGPRFPARTYLAISAALAAREMAAPATLWGMISQADQAMPEEGA